MDNNKSLILYYLINNDNEHLTNFDFFINYGMNCSNWHKKKINNIDYKFILNGKILNSDVLNIIGSYKSEIIINNLDIKNKNQLYNLYDIELKNLSNKFKKNLEDIYDSIILINSNVIGPIFEFGLNRHWLSRFTVNSIKSSDNNFIFIKNNLYNNYLIDSKSFINKISHIDNIFFRKNFLPTNFNDEKYVIANPFLLKTKYKTKQHLIYHYIKHGSKINLPYLPLDNKITNNIIINDIQINDVQNNNIDIKNILNTNNDIIEDNNMYMSHTFNENNITFNPKISVVIINYNNYDYLIKRLDSVYLQTRKPDEIIIIDDKSTDNSVDLINKYISDVDIPTKFIINNENSGSGYYNWIKGINECKYDYIWIAEADDYCDLNFIEVLLHEFKDKRISISYCKTHFVDTQYNILPFKMTSYLNKNWDYNFKNTNINLLNDFFCHRNIIPNVSSCIFLKPSIIILNEITQLLKQNIRLVIDWIFYILLSYNSVISYSVDTNNYYLLRNESVSNTIQKTISYIDETFYVANFINNNFNVKNNFIGKITDRLILEVPNKRDYILNYADKIKYKKRNILIFSYGFILGGGETFPIYLANALYESGENVFFMIPYKSDINPKIQNLLNTNIEVIKYKKNTTKNASENISEIIKNFNITHVNTHHQCCDKLMIDFCSENPDVVKHFITDHGMYANQSNNTKYLLECIYNVNSSIIYISKSNESNYNNYPINKYYIPIGIPNYSTDKINRIDYGLNENDFVIVLASRCMPEKGWEQAIEMINIINITNPNVKLLLLGDYNNSFGIKLYNNNHNPNIIFLGYKEKIKTFFELCDLGILPTYYNCESTPIVLMECLYANKPFISSNLGDISSMLLGDTDYAGSIIELNDGNIDIDLWIDELLKYINDKNYYNKKTVEIKNASNKFNIYKIKERYLEIFN